MVSALHSAFGQHHSRAVHAKGTILEGSFTPTAKARDLSRAAVFSGGPVPVTVRFSGFTGIPDIPDTIGDANPRGFAIKFHLEEGGELDLVTHSFNGFRLVLPTNLRNYCERSVRAVPMLGSRPHSIASSERIQSPRVS
jgi:catalase